MHICKPLTFKFADGQQGRFRGIAASFGPDPDRQGDVIQPGAFGDTLAAWEARGALIPILWQHDQAEPIGAVVSATETPEGLEIQGQLAPGIGNAERAMRLLQTGGLHMSIGFTIPAGGARLRGDGVRELIAVDLIEVSLVSIPADPRAVVREVKASPRSFEAVARDVLGLSAREAKRLAASGWTGLARDEPAEADPNAQAIEAALSRIANARIKA